MTASEPRCTFIGAGNMAEALVRGLLAAGRSADRLAASHPREQVRERWARDYGVQMYADNVEATTDADVVVVCVKPHKIRPVLTELAGKTDALLVSVAAGVPLDVLEAAVPDGRVIRSMPNQPSLLRAGATGLVAGTKATSDDLALATELFQAVGIVEVLPDEDRLDVLTGLAGSGPAFVYAVARALAAAGERLGLDAQVAVRLARQTVYGAGRILQAEDADPAELTRRVASPGGTTQAGLEELERRQADATLQAAVEAATRRAAELAEEARK